MRSHRLSQQFQLGVIPFLCLVSLTARAGDMARFMPHDTALYIGCSQWVEKDSAELRLAQELCEGVVKYVAAEEGEEEAARVKMMLDMLLPLQSGSAGVGLFDVTMVAGHPDVQAALVFDGPDTDHLAQTLRDFLVASGNAEIIECHTVKDVSMECIPLGDSAMYLLWGVYEHYFVLALGDAAAGKVIDCIRGEVESLADSAELKFNRKKVGADLAGRHFCVYVDVRRFIARGKEIATELLGELPPLVDPALDELGLTSMRSKYLHADQRNGQPRFMVFAHVDGPMRGLLKLYDQKPLTEDDLEIVPKNAYWAGVGNLNLAGLWQEAMRVLETLAPDLVPVVDGSLAMSSQLVGFSLTDDLLPAFGDTWAMFDAPDHGGILLSGTVLVAEVEDAEALQGMLTRLVQFLTPLVMQADATLELKQLTRGEHEIHYVLIGGVPSPVAPAWAFADDRWVLALYPQTVATALRQVDSRTRGESLLDHPDFQAARAKLPKGIQGVDYLDSEYFTRMFYPFINAVQTLAVSMFATHGVELDLEVMPPLPEAAADVTNFVGTLSKDQDGVLYAAAGDGTAVVAVAATTALGTSVLLPSLARSREISKRAVSAANLRGMGQVCSVYAADNQEKFPDSLDQLLEGGLITRKMLHSPRDPDTDAVSYVYISGQTSNSDPRNVLAYERIRGDEGTAVLFADGHVEWVKIEEFKRALRETYRRLGREDEIPAEFRELVPED